MHGARLVREDGEARLAAGRTRVLVAPAQHVEGGVDVALGGEVEPRAHVPQRRAHVVRQPVVELVHALLVSRAMASRATASRAMVSRATVSGPIVSSATGSVAVLGSIAPTPARRCPYLLYLL